MNPTYPTCYQGLEPYMCTVTSSINTHLSLKKSSLDCLLIQPTNLLSLCRCMGLFQVFMNLFSQGPNRKIRCFWFACFSVSFVIRIRMCPINIFSSFLTKNHVLCQVYSLLHYLYTRIQQICLILPFYM